MWAIAQLSQSKPFGLLPAAEIERLAGSPRVRLGRDEVLFEAGATAEAVYLVLSGELSLEIIDIDGKSIAVSCIRAGAVTGELAVLDGKPRSVAARAAEEAVLLSIPASSFLTLVRTYPDFALEIIRDLASKVRATNEKVSGLTFHTLRARVAALLADLADAHGADACVLHITQAEIAGRLAASREKVNGHLQAIQSGGAIRLSRGRVEIKSRAALRRLGGD